MNVIVEGWNVSHSNYSINAAGWWTCVLRKKENATSLVDETYHVMTDTAVHVFHSVSVLQRLQMIDIFESANENSPNSMNFFHISLFSSVFDVCFLHHLYAIKCLHEFSLDSLFLYWPVKVSLPNSDIAIHIQFPYKFEIRSCWTSLCANITSEKSSFYWTRVAITLVHEPKKLLEMFIYTQRPNKEQLPSLFQFVYADMGYVTYIDRTKLNLGTLFDFIHESLCDSYFMCDFRIWIIE